MGTRRRVANLGRATLFSYAVSKDGQRFLISSSGANEAKAAAAVTQPIVVAQNWAERLRK